MYWREHDPAHFHAYYNDYSIVVEIESGVVDGKFPKRALKLVLEWAELHKQELLENWLFAKQRTTLKKISPLE